MGNNPYVIITLLSVIVGLCLVIGFLLSHIQKLVDKLMSRSYTEYVSATKPTTPRPQPVDQAPQEDLSPLQEFQLQI